MEQSLSLAQELKTSFDLKEKDWRQYSPLALAFLGDTVYDLVIRQILVSRHDIQSQKLHRMAIKVVNAGTQAKMADVIGSRLDMEEESIFRRGCNAKPATHPKSATLEEYHKATGLETLMGYLYLKGEYARICELLALGLEETGNEL